MSANDNPPAVGDRVRCWLPGERFSGRVAQVIDRETIVARIEDHLIGPLHGYRRGDSAVFRLNRDLGLWDIAPALSEVRSA